VHHELGGEFGDRAGRGRHVSHPAGPSTSSILRRPDTYLARRLGHIDRGDPLDDQLVLGVGNLLRLQFCLLLHLCCPPNTFTLDRSGRLGASVKGTEILTGVLEATVRDPSRSGPGARLKYGITRPRKRRRRQATRPNFHACEASPGGMGGSNEMSIACPIGRAREKASGGRIVWRDVAPQDSRELVGLAYQEHATSSSRD